MTKVSGRTIKTQSSKLWFVCFLGTDGQSGFGKKFAAPRPPQYVAPSRGSMALKLDSTSYLYQPKGEWHSVRGNSWYRV